MLDDFQALQDADSSGLLAKLAALPGVYDGPDGKRSQPYGLVGYGEAASLAHVFSAWIDAPLVASGTQFIFAGGFDFGDAAPLKLSAELSGAEVVLLGHSVHEPDLNVPPSPFSFYHYASYLAHATGHSEELSQVNSSMKDFLIASRPDVATEQNPAKTLAWKLWNRVPILLAGKRQTGLADLIQRVFGRVGKSLAITVGDHPLETLTGAFEGRHSLADDLVLLELGEADKERELAREVLSSRVAQVETLSVPDELSAPGRSLALWYMAMWTAAYLAILHKLDPADSPVYEATRQASLEPSDFHREAVN